MSEDFSHMDFNYEVIFKRIGETYRLISYNTPWDNERELDDIKVIFEGKDLKNNDLPAYKQVKWEGLTPGEYKACISMRFVKNVDATFDQIFKLISLELVNAC